MAALIPNAFPDTSNPAIASYSYTDIAEGTGVIKLYGFIDSGGTPTLAEQVVYSSSIESTGSKTTSGAYSTISDLDFDLSAFNYPKMIKGTALVGYGYAFDQTNYGYGKIIFTVRKWDGTTETDIASGTWARENAPDAKAAQVTKITIPEHHFKRGEILRLNVLSQARSDDASAVRLTIGTDPMNRDGTYIIPSTDTPTTTTKLEFYCPFKIDI
jgi:hypothetical protein